MDTVFYVPTIRINVNGRKQKRYTVTPYHTVGLAHHTCWSSDEDLTFLIDTEVKITAIVHTLDHGWWGVFEYNNTEYRVLLDWLDKKASAKQVVRALLKGDKDHA